MGFEMGMAGMAVAGEALESDRERDDACFARLVIFVFRDLDWVAM